MTVRLTPHFGVPTPGLSEAPVQPVTAEGERAAAELPPPATGEQRSFRPEPGPPGTQGARERPRIEDLPVIRVESPYVRDEPGELPLIQILQTQLGMPREERDGVFGPDTSSWLWRWQEAWNAENPHDPVFVDGVMGPQVYRRLLFPERPAPAAEPALDASRDVSRAAEEQAPVERTEIAAAEVGDDAGIDREAEAVRPEGTVEVDDSAPAIRSGEVRLDPPTLSVGSRDAPGEIAWVHELQRRLEIGVDGIFGGGETQPAVIAFQQGYNAENREREGFVPLREDGTVDPATWAALPERPRAPDTLTLPPAESIEFPAPYAGDTSLAIGFEDRAAGAATGGAFIGDLGERPAGSREARIVNEIAAGNLPDHLREYVPIAFTRGGMEVELYMTSDVLSIGSNDDYMPIPMHGPSAEAVAESVGALLPTNAMVRLRWENADYRFRPAPQGASARMTHPSVYADHGRAYDREGTEGALVAGVAKLVLIDPTMSGGRLGYGGWTEPNGHQIQDPGRAHGETYADYSHGVALTAPFVRINGTFYATEDILAHPVLYRLISEHRFETIPRYRD